MCLKLQHWLQYLLISIKWRCEGVPYRHYTICVPAQQIAARSILDTQTSIYTQTWVNQESLVCNNCNVTGQGQSRYAGWYWRSCAWRIKPVLALSDPSRGSRSPESSDIVLEPGVLEISKHAKNILCGRAYNWFRSDITDHQFVHRVRLWGPKINSWFEIHHF